VNKLWRSSTQFNQNSAFARAPERSGTVFGLPVPVFAPQQSQCISKAICERFLHAYLSSPSDDRGEILNQNKKFMHIKTRSFSFSKAIAPPTFCGTLVGPQVQLLNLHHALF
jgi:hypothetical protein